MTSSEFMYIKKNMFLRKIGIARLLQNVCNTNLKDVCIENKI